MPNDQDAEDARYRAQYNTPLSPQEEANYQSWVKQESQKQGRNLSNDEIDYDLRGDWKAGASRDERGHGGDTYKKPNHPTFSEESKYHGVPGSDGTVNEGGKWVQDANGAYTGFQQGSTNRKFWAEPAIRDYLKQQEPGVSLVQPQSQDMKTPAPISTPAPTGVPTKRTPSKNKASVI